MFYLLIILQTVISLRLMWTIWWFTL